MSIHVAVNCALSCITLAWNSTERTTNKTVKRAYVTYNSTVKPLFLFQSFSLPRVMVPLIDISVQYPGSFPATCQKDNDHGGHLDLAGHLRLDSSVLNGPYELGHGSPWSRIRITPRRTLDHTGNNPALLPMAL